MRKNALDRIDFKYLSTPLTFRIHAIIFTLKHIQWVYGRMIFWTEMKKFSWSIWQRIEIDISQSFRMNNV